MNFYPAIDIKDGKFIRLKQGRLDEVTVYGNSPVKIAKKFTEAGAKWIHVVDIDGAFKGKSINQEIILNIKKNSKSKIQVGGGIRTEESASFYLDNEIDRIVLGTIALEKPKIIEKLCKKYPGRIAVGIDAKKGMVATEGWSKTSTIEVSKLSRLYENIGVSCVIFTDIEKDGLMEGVSVNQLVNLLEKTKLNIIASGGVSSLDDLKKLKQLEKKNLIGVISGKAIYENKFSVNEAIEILGN
jgi:phosphoribosylformimino-5-aminoimidazole carboxamide ribotide isomerase